LVRKGCARFQLTNTEIAFYWINGAFLGDVSGACALKKKGLNIVTGRVLAVNKIVQYRVLMQFGFTSAQPQRALRLCGEFGGKFKYRGDAENAEMTQRVETVSVPNTEPLCV
jgi:hypothetical protein